MNEKIDKDFIKHIEKLNQLVQKGRENVSNEEIINFLKESIILEKQFNDKINAEKTPTNFYQDIIDNDDGTITLGKGIFEKMITPSTTIKVESTIELENKKKKLDALKGAFFTLQAIEQKMKLDIQKLQKEIDEV